MPRAPWSSFHGTLDLLFLQKIFTRIVIKYIAKATTDSRVQLFHHSNSIITSKSNLCVQAKIVEIPEQSFSIITH